MLHSLSHLLITALSLDCGYSASALRERVHSLSAGYGILLYTGTSGSEGSLGGLVEMGKNVGRLIERALLAGDVPLGPLDAVLAALSAMEREGMTPNHIAHVVGMLAEETPPPPTPTPAQPARASLGTRFAARSGQAVVFLTSITIRARFRPTPSAARSCMPRSSLWMRPSSLTSWSKRRCLPRFRYSTCATCGAGVPRQ